MYEGRGLAFCSQAICEARVKSNRQLQCRGQNAV
jgi:hypothetical protein